MTSTPAPAVWVRGVSKTFRVGFFARKVVACRDITLSVPRGEVYGLVGPNGAGKSTTLKLILGFVRPDEGEGQLLERPLGSREARGRLGYLPELPGFPRYLTAEELLDFHGQLAGVPPEGWGVRRAALLQRVGLERAAKVRMGRYSKGMLQRVGLAVALCSEPELLVLDEPMSGLDPLGRHDVRSIIREQKQLGRTVIFSSHVLSDVEALCDRVAIISQGTVFRQGRLDEISGASSRPVEIQLHGLDEEKAAALNELGRVRRQGALLLWEVQQPQRLNEALALALRLGAGVGSVTPRAESLEEIIVQATATTSREGRIAP